MYLLITDRCNLACKHCFVSGSHINKKASLLSYSDITSIIDQLCDMNVFKLVITGGEPFLRDDILDIVHYANTQKLNVQINSNGSLITDKLLQEISKRKLQISHFTLSCEGYEELHDEVRGKGNFQKFSNSVNILKSYGFEVLINIVARSEIMKNKDRVFSLLNSMQCKRFNFAMLRPTGSAIFNREYFSYSINDTIDFFRDVKQFQKDHGLESYAEIIDSPTYYRFAGSFCNAASVSLAITPAGCVTPCPYLDELCGMLDIDLDNVYDKPLAEIWKKSKSFSYMREFSNSCQSCMFASSCGQQCPVESYVRGDIKGRGLYCLFDDHTTLLKDKFLT
ncbi:MAG: radical SAM protein [Candidatus Wallbacteria bacterium]|nr:radical SAM protein [Candidatus Wallbacteria bacterium]